MALTRKQLWIATYVALCVVALYFIAFPPKRKARSSDELPVPAAQLGVGSGCDAKELPRSLNETPPPSLDRSAPQDETPQMKQAREVVTACLLHKLWPAASLQFEYDAKGTGHFDLVFPNNAYRRASAITMSQVSDDKATVTVGAFLWLPHDRELAMPPLVIARADSEGRVNYFNAQEVDADARLVEDWTPQWVSGEESTFAFTYEGMYQDGARIAWLGTVDLATAEVAQRIPQKVGLAAGEWTLRQESSDATSVLLRAMHGGESRDIRVRCERSSGAMCVVGARDLISEMSFATK